MDDLPRHARQLDSGLFVVETPPEKESDEEPAPKTGTVCGPFNMLQDYTQDDFAAARRAGERRAYEDEQRIMRKVFGIDPAAPGADRSEMWRFGILGDYIVTKPPRASSPEEAGGSFLDFVRRQYEVPVLMEPRQLVHGVTEGQANVLAATEGAESEPALPTGGVGELLVAAEETGRPVWNTARDPIARPLLRRLAVRPWEPLNWCAVRDRMEELGHDSQAFWREEHGAWPRSVRFVHRRDLQRRLRTFRGDLILLFGDFTAEPADTHNPCEARRDVAPGEPG